MIVEWKGVKDDFTPSRDRVTLHPPGDDFSPPRGISLKFRSSQNFTIGIMYMEKDCT